MGLLFSLITAAFGITVTIGFWVSLAALLTFVLLPIYADMGYVYGPEDSADYATWIMVLMLFNDRYFGIYGRTLRKICKHLSTGREAVTESYEYDR